MLIPVTPCPDTYCVLYRSKSNKYDHHRTPWFASEKRARQALAIIKRKPEFEVLGLVRD